MKLPDYNDGIVNLANSIMKYFELKPFHKSLSDIDKILNKNKPTNVVIILYDGMGYNLLKRNLPSNSFLNQNLVRGYSSVSPATTTASTTSIMTGLMPMEHGWLGWDLYIKPVDKVVTMFLNTIKDTETAVADYNVSKKYFPYKTITDLINEKGNYYSKILFPFGNDSYKDIDDMNDKIISECHKKGKKFIYAYYLEPDSTMHHYGTDSKEAMVKFDLINKKTEELCSKLKDTLVIITADHGHLNGEGVLLSDYPDFKELLDGDIWLEGRLCSFKVKKGKKKLFKQLFKEYFKNDFVLKSKKDIIKMQLFGIGKANPLFDSSLGDYFALAKGNKYFRYSDNSVNLKSMHAGFTDDEMIIPLIVVER